MAPSGPKTAEAKGPADRTEIFQFRSVRGRGVQLAAKFPLRGNFGALFAAQKVARI